MDKDLQDIEDLFKKGLEGHEDAPSEKVWDSIDQSLYRTSGLRIRKKYYILKWATAFLALGLAAMSIFVFRNLSENTHVGGTINGKVAADSLSKTLHGVPYLENRPSASGTAQENSNRAGKNSGIITPDRGNRQETMRGSHSEWQLPLGSRRSKSLPQRGKPGSYQDNTVPVSGYAKASNPSYIDVQMSAAKSAANTTTKTEPVRIVDHKPVEVIEANRLKGISTLSPFSKPATIKSGPIRFSRTKPLDITVFYSPDIPFSHLRDEDNSFGNPYSRELEKREKPTYSYSFGIGLSYHLNTKWAFATGLGFSMIKMNMEPEKIFAQRDNQGTVKFQINTSAGKGYVVPSFSAHPQIGDSLFTRNSSHSLRYISIPLTAKYYLGYKRLLVNLQAGLSTNILCREKISTDVNRGNESEHENIHEIHGLRSVYLSGIAGVGMDYHIYRNISLFFSPIINIAIQPINKNVPVNSYPRTLDFRIGLNEIL